VLGTAPPTSRAASRLPGNLVSTPQATSQQSERRCNYPDVSTEFPGNVAAVEARMQVEQAESGVLAMKNEKYCKESGHSQAADSTKEG